MPCPGAAVIATITLAVASAAAREAAVFPSDNSGVVAASDGGAPRARSRSPLSAALKCAGALMGPGASH